MTDPLQALVLVLRADQEVAARTSSRVYGGELPEDVPQTQLQPTVLLRFAGGDLLPITQSYVELGDVRVDVWCYGTTPREAHELYRCVRGALKQMTRTVQRNTLLHWAKPSGGPISGRDPDSEWPFTLSSWQVLASERATA